MREDMSGSGRRHHHHKKGGRHLPSPQTLDDPQVPFDAQFIQQQPTAALQYPHGFAYSHRRLEANAPGTRYDGANPADGRLYMNSHSNPVYNPLDQHQLQIGQYGAPDFQGPYHNPYNLGVGIPYDEYDNSMYGPSNGTDYYTYAENQQLYEQQPGNAYYNPPGMMQPQYPAPVGYYTNSPPTPAASDQVGDRKRVKEKNRPIAPYKSTETPRVTPDDVPHSGKAPRRKSSASPVKPAKPTKTKKGKRDVPALTAPLSELTKSYDHIPLKDMDEWVNRSVETRLKECTKKEGWIPRPMNSFMLYRSAYAERTKHWCLQNNHQVVSSVSGLSWPMEPPEIRERFIEYARQERENHAKAHPGYKFSPAKTDASRRKRKGATKEQDDDQSVDLQEFDDDWQPSRSSKNTKRKGRAKRAKTANDPQHPVNLDFQVEYGGHAGPEHLLTEQSTFEFNNPGKLPPPQLDNLQDGELYQAIVDFNSLGAGRVEDVSFLKTDASQPHSEATEELVGLPGADHELLLDPQLNADNFNLGINPDIGLPLDPNLDSLFLDFDFDQLNELNGGLGDIFQGIDHHGFLDTSENNTVDPQVSGNQHEDQNEAENGHKDSAQNKSPKEYKNGYQNQRPEEGEDKQSMEFPNTPDKTSIPEHSGLKPQKKPRKLDHGKHDDEKLDDEKFDDEKFDDEKPGDEKPGDEKPVDEKPGDEKPGDEKPGDEKPVDEKLGHEKLDRGPGDNKKTSSTKKRSR